MASQAEKSQTDLTVGDFGGLDSNFPESLSLTFLIYQKWETNAYPDSSSEQQAPKPKPRWFVTMNDCSHACSVKRQNRRPMVWSAAHQLRHASTQDNRKVRELSFWLFHLWLPTYTKGCLLEWSWAKVECVLLETGPSLPWGSFN